MFTKTSPPSIPTRFMTYHYDTNEPKAFNSTTRRFSGSVNELPGPGFYQVAGTKPSSEHVSLSRKGLGGFASKTSYKDKIPTDLRPTSIGPGQYDLARKMEYSRGMAAKASSAFCLPLARTARKKGFPGPGDYDTSTTWTTKSACTSVNFKSRAPRTGMVMDLPGKDAPPPGQYDVSDTFLSTHQTPAAAAGTAAASAAFRATARPDLNRPSGSIRRDTEPGPADYDVLKKVRHGKPQRRIIGSVAVKPGPPGPRRCSPGPAAYNVHDAAQHVLPHSPQAHRSAFRSTTARLVLPFDLTMPGPTVYRPKQTATGRGYFRLNLDEKWVC